MASKVSFTIRRPTPVSRAASSGPDSDAASSFKVPQLPSHISTPTPLGTPLARSEVSSPHPHRSAPEDHEKDSSDEDSVIEDELVTGFDKFGVQRLNGEKKVEKPLIIPALKNKDWRELARKRRGPHYVPPSAAAQTGKDGSVGGLGTRDTINSGPVLSGLQVKQKTVLSTQDEVVVQETEGVKMEVVEEETEDQKALRAILAESGGEHQDGGPMIDIIPAPMSEADALKQDVDELPDAATMEDYARVPVSQFGAALLRGMGWKEGTAATRKPGRGLVEPYLPSARPALLGIGAKEQEVFDDGSKKSNKNKRPERRYVPIIKQERADTGSPSGRERSRSPRRSATSSRRNSPDRYNDRNEKTGDRRRYDDGRYRESDRRGVEAKDRRRDDNREREIDGDRRRDEDRDRDRRRDDGGGRQRREDDRERLETKRERSYDPSRRKRDF
ncbi:hypothetical protein GALMADRAFT_69508 [Galerina marginata CBS 339.88]|uniref:G-patch domain-containing protein n=1 Tax=Galerina marginata (strain CBS 339.88) TaxID=685588 RepID=A0A067SYX8_GALM3|nr:hypothetical protein GALMADRAFT_69508 [Galerina marginata CBS 339.88]